MKSRLTTQDTARISLLAALICVSGYLIIPLPFSPVPATAQSLAIMLTGSLLSPFHTFATLTLFIFLGIIGLPVFAGGASGFGVLLGPTGGYLAGFLVGAVTISFLKGKRTNLLRFVFANTVGGILVVYLMGLLRLSQLTGMTLGNAFMVGAAPFLAGDVIKVLLAAVMTWRITPHLRRQY